MPEIVKIVECPRDGWQGLPVRIPADVKVRYLTKLLAAGFRHIDAVSFVSPAAIPQTADSEEVLGLLDLPGDIEIIGIIVNAKGAERAIDTGLVQTLGFPYSVSATFLKRNQNQTPQEALHKLTEILSLAEQNTRGVVAYVSMAFGNPYGETCSIDDVIATCKRLIAIDVRQISLADTVGLATPSRISEMLEEVLTACNGAEIGVHLHSRPNEAAAKIRAAYEAGCRRFDAAMGGLGGCPFAQDALVGNIPTEILIAELQQLGASLPELGPLDKLTSSISEIAQRFGVQPTHYSETTIPQR